MALQVAQKAQVVKQYQRSGNDTGSPEVQVALLTGFPATRLDAASEARLRNGQPLKISGLQEGLCAVYRADGAVIGLARAHAEGVLKAVRLTQTADKARKTL